MRKTKKWLALLLAVCMVVPNLNGMVSDNLGIVQAAEEETAKTWDSWVGDLSEDAEMAVRLGENEQQFNGNSVKDVSGTYAQAIKNVETGSIIMRFKANSTASARIILGTRNSTAAMPSDITKSNNAASAMLVAANGKFRFTYPHTQAEKEGPHSFTDGNWHTVVLSCSASGKNIRITIDGVEQWSITNRTDLVGMFNKQSVIDTVTIGGHKNGNSVVGGFNGSISDVIVTSAELTDAEAIAISAAGCIDDEEPELENPFDTNGGTGANYSRIPAMITTKDGVVIAAADSRFGGTHDSPNNIDIMVVTSEDDGATWSAPELVFHYDDYADDTLDIPQGTQTRVNDSASFIDPILLQDDEIERVFLIADAMYSGTGSPQAVTGSGYKEIDGVKYMKLKKNGETEYNYSLRENNVIWNDSTNTATEYTLNANFEILKNGVLQTVKQKTSSVSASGALTSATTNVDVAMNIMYADAVFKPLPTTWLYMKYSDDNGQTWSDPVFLNGMVKPEDSSVFIVGPGRGTQIKNGEYAGRLIVPVYDASKAGIIYSDDHGDTWTYAPGASTANAAMSETQIVELPDGSLRVFARSNNSKIATAVSLDGGETWTAAEYVPGLSQPGWGSQLSVITYSEEIDGKPAIILSSPAGVGSYRRDGRVKIGLITETENTGADKYQIDWAYDYQVDETNVGYAYSCLTELTNGDIGLLYEKYDSYNPAELHAKHAIKYETFTLEELMENRDPASDVRDIPVSAMKATAGSAYAGDGGQGADKAIDEDTGTIWHTDWANDKTSRDNHWIAFELNETYAVDGLRYLNRLDNAKGCILGFKVQVSDDGESWTDVVSNGSFVDSKAWQLITFDKVETRYARLKVEDSTTDSTNAKFAAAAEIRLTGAIPVDPSVEVDEDLLKAGSISVTEDSVTENQPFAANTAGSNLFRIPALITLDNGDLLAVADARWQTSADWGGLDTIASVSSDNGKTWQYSFPIFFPDSNLSTGAKQSTTIIDPVIVQGNDGTIYCVVDVNPTSITTGDIMPAPEIGFVEINGVQRLVLTDTYTQPTNKDWATYGNPEDYEYYVGDFEDGFAKVFKKADNRATDWIVDEWYNIYKLDKTENAYKPLTQTQVNSDTVIQQNAYYAASELHVYNTGYLWLVTSTDNGKSWSAPTILNTQIKREGEVALLASPGQGMVASNGDIIIPFYDHGDSQENASIIWSSDNGKTWTRSNDVSGMWSSENEIVELYDGVLRMFFRNGNNVICYADITKENGVWTMGQGVRTSIPVRSGCNVTAINCSETIDNKKVVMVACPSDPNGRNDGNIYTFLINEDNTMELYNIFSVNKGAYAYSCMTEMANGNIGLLWEPAAAAIRFDEFELDVVLGHKKIVTVDAGATWVEETVADKAKEITTAPDETIATVTSEFVVEDTITALHNFGTSAAGVKDSFQAEADVTKSLSDAEFTFTKNGDKWQLKNGTKYVVLSSSDSYFGNSAADVTVSMNETNGTVRIYNNDNRYMLFLKSTSTANYNYYDAYKTTTPDSAESSDARLEFDLVLLEAKGDSNAAEVAPGYVRATSVQDGKNYIIAYIDGDAVVVLYPTNGKTAQTKLVGETVEIAKNVVTITGVKPGTTSAVIDEILYSIVVEDPTIRADYAGNDYPAEKLTATAGAAQGGTTEGPAELALDEDPLTHFHSAWSPKCTDDQLWLTVELEEAQDVTGVRYLPRNGAGNGTVTAYEIFCSMDGEHWTSVTTGNWELNGEWKIARFDEAVEAKYVKLFAVDSTGDKNGRHMSAAEVRVTVAPEVPEIPEVPETPKEEVCKVFTDVKHGEWYEEAIQYVYDNGIMGGNKGVFNPAGNITREQVIATLYNMEDDKTVNNYEAVNALKDVKAGQWYTDAVCWAYNTGVAQGNSSTKLFGIGKPITREQLATMLYNYSVKKGYDTTTRGDYSGMKDANKVSSYAVEFMQWAYGTGLIGGGTNLNPQGYATRAQMASMMRNFCLKNSL